jgi:hypothetical protein
MGFVQSLNFLPKFTGSILHILSFLPKFLGFMHRLSFLLKFGTNAAWWPFSTPQLFSGCHSLPKVSRCNVKHESRILLAPAIHPNVAGSF